MEPTIYKPGAYNTPGVYKGAGWIYNGQGVYNDGAGGGPIGDILHYKSDLKNFDISTMTDYPLEGSPQTYTLYGTKELENNAEGLLVKPGNFSFITTFGNPDISNASKIVFKGTIKTLNYKDSVSWAWADTNYTNNIYNGQGFWLLQNNLTTNYTLLFTESHSGVLDGFYVPYAGAKFLNEDVTYVREWDKGTKKVITKFRNEEAGINNNIPSYPYNYFNFSIGTNKVEFIVRQIEVDVFS